VARAATAATVALVETEDPAGTVYLMSFARAVPATEATEDEPAEAGTLDVVEQVERAGTCLSLSIRSARPMLFVSLRVAAEEVRQEHRDPQASREKAVRGARLLARAIQVDEHPE
jgi:hypothetical protein